MQKENAVNATTPTQPKAISIGVAGAPGPNGGMLVTELKRFGSVAKAGIQVGDEIVATNGAKFTTIEQWQADLMKIGIGNTATIRVVQAGKQVDIAMKILEKKTLNLEVKALEEVLERKISP